MARALCTQWAGRMGRSHRTTWRMSQRGYQFGYSKPDPLPLAQLVADFRSDTVTRISGPMKEAMFHNENYGDNVYDEDLIVHELEQQMAERCGKESALFCATGTMTNQLALRCQLGALQSLLCDARAHIYNYEAGGVAYHSQAQCRPIEPALQKGYRSLSPQEVEQAILPPDVHVAVTAGVALENTVWGTVVPLDHIREIKKVCETHGLFLHLDGARLPNACVKAGLSLREYAEPFDSLSVCLSKSLACPIGSVVVGSSALIQRAKHFRKLMGGGWRQSGLLASAALYALDHHWDRLVEDHDNAAYLAHHLGAMGFGEEVPTETNQIFLHSRHLGVTWDTIAAACRQAGLLIPGGEYSCRLVTHIQTSREACDRLLSVIQDCLHRR